jgi:hypothetical protein
MAHRTKEIEMNQTAKQRPPRPVRVSSNGWPDSLAVPHSGVTDIDGALKYSALVFRDPDNIQLELFFMGG